MTARVKTLAVAFTALALACGSVEAQPRGYHGGYHGGGYYHRGGPGWFGPGLLLGGIGLGLGLSYAYRPYDYVVVDRPATVYYNTPPVVVQQTTPAAPVPSSQPEPIFYPRNGQSAAQLEADRQACNRWATGQPNAVADASVFQRSTLACMDGRGYTSR